jgi:hypothetical protein
LCIRGEYERAEVDEGEDDPGEDQDFHLSIREWVGVMYLVIGFHQSYVSYYRRLAESCGLRVRPGRPVAVLEGEAEGFPLVHSNIYTLEPSREVGSDLEVEVSWMEESRRLEEYSRMVDMREPEAAMAEGEGEEEEEGVEDEIELADKDDEEEL